MAQKIANKRRTSERAKVAKSAKKAKPHRGRRWSQRVTEESAALILEPGVFTQSTPRAIALSLKRSADKSQQRKSEPYRSAMSMLTFYINRAGKGLPAARKRILEKAKDELRAVYGKVRPEKTG